MTPKIRLTHSLATHETRHQVRSRLLSDRAHHVEFNGFLTNHVKHAIIALDGLDAPRARLEDYFDTYATETPYGFGLEPAQRARTTITRDDLSAHLGRREDFEALRNFFAAEVRAHGVPDTLARFIPTLAPGFVGALLHGTIHLGWALDADEPDMVIEGLAYLAFTFVSSHPERAQARLEDRTVDDTLARLAAEADDLPAWLEDTKQRPELSLQAGFQNQLAGTGAQRTIAQVLARGHWLLDARPAWVDDAPLPEVWRQLHEDATRLYLAEGADFVLLHVITGLHALEQIADAVPSYARGVVLHGWRALVGILLARGRFVHATLPARSDERARVNEAAWAPVIERAWAEAEEHNIKLVYVLRRHWARYGRRRMFLDAAEAFIETPTVRRFEPTEGGGFEMPDASARG